MSGIIQRFPVEKEYEKDPNITPEDIRKLREWLKTQPHLPEPHISDLDLVLVYSCCDRSTEVSKQLLDTHFTFRTQLTKLLTYREVDESILSVLETVVLAPLGPTVHGSKALYGRLIDGDPKNYRFTDIMRAFIMMYDLLQYEEGTWPGFELLVDMDLITLAHLGRVDLTTLRETLLYHEKGVLSQLKRIHFLNAPSFMDKLMMLIKPLTTRALLDRILIHERGSESIYKFIPKDSFPKEMGGKYKDNMTLKDELINRFKNNKEFFEKENLRRVNETLRPNGKKTADDNLVTGSFKKLDID